MTSLQRHRVFAALLTVLLVVSAAAVRADEVDTRLLRQLRDRLERLDFDDAAAVFELAQWARRQEMLRYADELYRRTLDADPLHERAMAELHDLAAEHGLVDDADLRAKLVAEFPERFRLHESDHFLVVHDTDRERARETAALLERTRGVFYRAFEEGALPPRPLRERLVVVLFAEREAFDRYAQQTDEVEREWSLGHYSPRSNRVVFYRELGGSDLERYTERVIDVKGRIRVLVQAREQAQQQGGSARVRRIERDLREARSELALLRSRRDRLAEATDTARTTHEAAHQLAWNAGLLRRGVVYPVWLVEGMATHFEAPQPDASFGPGVENRYRRAALFDAWERDALLPLDELIARTEPPDDGEAVRDLYAQSYGLFGYLFERYPDELRAYMAALYTQPRGRDDAALLRRAFADAFGDVAGIEREFRAYVRSME